MNDNENPCYSAATTAQYAKCEMTLYQTPKLGRVAVPTHLINSIHCPDGATLLVSYSSVAFKVSGRNLGPLFDLLVARRLESVTAVNELSYRFSPTDIYVGAIDVVTPELGAS